MEQTLGLRGWKSFIVFFSFFFQFDTRIFIYFTHDEQYTGRISTKLLENNEKHFSHRWNRASY